MLGLVFVLLVCFLRRGLIGGIKDLFALIARRSAGTEEPQDPFPRRDGRRAKSYSSRDRHSGCGANAGPPPQERSILRPYSAKRAV